ncbi:MAG: cysteine desulfurase family protein [Alphaproteobacteria bacterium]
MLMQIVLFICLFSFNIFSSEVYLDNNATTQCDPRVLDAMMPYFCQHFGNPNSTTHECGRKAKEALEEARIKIADGINAKPHEIVFTSGATESNNIAIKCIARAYKHKTGPKHIITCVIEHKSVLEPCKALQKEGFKVTFLPVGKNGLININSLKRAITKSTILVSIMVANNEIGVCQPIDEIGFICKKHKILFHTDGAQAVGKIPLDVKKSNIDLLSMSGHKVYGPKGVGALYIKNGIKIEPLIHGGKQEGGFRPGTENIPGYVGLGEAVSLAVKELPKELYRILSLREKFLEHITSSLDGIVINGDLKHRLPGNLSISIRGTNLKNVIEGLKGFAVSAGSACTADENSSYVIRAINHDNSIPPTTIRICIGRFTTEREVMSFADRLIKVVKHLREKVPSWSCQSSLNETCPFLKNQRRGKNKTFL